jgi:glycosyltransferase involved in cell wall biosynthesis
VGDGPERQSLQALASELGLSESVDFAGYQPQDVVRQWMQRAKLLVLPSLEEGLGVVLLEALASGTPIVASEVGGIVDVVTPGVGVLVPPGDASGLANAIANTLLDADRWLAKSVRARDRAVELYDWDRIGEQYARIYAEILGAA